MDEDKSTDQPVEQAAAEEVTPAAVSTDVESPEATQTEPSEAPEASEVEEPAAPEADDKLRKFAASQGIELDSPNAIKAAQALQKARSEATRNHQKASELEKTIDTSITEEAETAGLSDDDRVDLARLKTKMTLRDFWDANPDARQFDTKMAEIVQERPYLAGDLEALYALAQVRGGNTSAVKAQAKQETLQSLAHKQQAAVPTGNATNPGTTPKTKPFADLSIAEMEAQLGKVRR